MTKPFRSARLYEAGWRPKWSPIALDRSLGSTARIVPLSGSPIVLLHTGSEAHKDWKEMYAVGEVNVVPNATAVRIPVRLFETVVPLTRHEFAPVVVTGQYINLTVSA